MKRTLLFLAALPLSVLAALNGKVVSIHDGDTLTLLTEQNKQVKVRLAEIDTPEFAQPFGTKSRQMLADMVFSKQISVDVTDTDRYGRKVGKIYLGDTWVNREMVKQGGAWVYRQYNHSPNYWLMKPTPKPINLGYGHYQNQKECRHGNGARMARKRLFLANQLLPLNQSK